MNKNTILSIITILILTLKIKCQDFTVDGRYIYNGDKPFTALGMNYSPMPIGGSQVFDESDRGDTYGPDWSFVHDRDLPIMRSMGINSIRIYNFYPWKFPSIEIPEWNEALDLDHTSFLDKLWNNGDKPIYIWISFHMPICFHYKTSPSKPTNRYSWRLQSGQWAYLDPDWDAADEATRKFVENAYIKLVEKYGTHPAVIGFVLGNEQNDEISRFNPYYWNFINTIAGKIKTIVNKKLTMISIVDDGNLSVRAAESIGLIYNIDVWGINSYRGTKDEGFDILFTEYATLSNKPLLITEYGPPASTRDENNNVIIMPENAKDQATYIKVHFDDMINHRHICSGGYIFEWVDEWWKHKNPESHDPSDAPNGAYPGGHGDEEFFGIFGVQMITNSSSPSEYKTRGPDSLIERAAVRTIAEMYLNYDHDDIPPQEDPIPQAPVTPLEPLEPFEPAPVEPNPSTPNPPTSSPVSTSEPSVSPEAGVPEPTNVPQQSSSAVQYTISYVLLLLAIFMI